MGPSVSQLRLLSPEDRILYKQWLRRSLLFYSSVAAIAIVAVLVNHLLSPAPLDVASNTRPSTVAAATK